MRKPSLLSVLALLPLLCIGCDSHPMTDYRPLDKAGMWSGAMAELRKLNTTDAEISQVVILKNAGVNDDMCIALVAAAHTHHHPFASAESAKSLNGAGFTDEQILAFARRDQLDALSPDAVMLRLIGLSDPTVQKLLQRRMQGLPTLSSAEIGRLKNTGLSEKEIMAQIESGMTDPQADAEASAREKMRAHNGTGFMHVRGRRR